MVTNFQVQMDTCTWKYLIVPLAVSSTFLKEYLRNFLVVTRLKKFMFKVYGKFGISKIEF